MFPGSISEKGGEEERESDWKQLKCPFQNKAALLLREEKEEDA